MYCIFAIFLANNGFSFSFFTNSFHVDLLLEIRIFMFGAACSLFLCFVFVAA
jgi:hypothetical protein